MSTSENAECDHLWKFTGRVHNTNPPRYVYECTKCKATTALKEHILPPLCSHIWGLAEHHLGPNYTKKICHNCGKTETRAITTRASCVHEE